MRTVVYTAITGGKDILRPPFQSKANPKWMHDTDYICFTDEPEKCEGKGWKVQEVDNPYGDTPEGFCRSARRFKHLPHKYLPEGYDASVWIDGSMEILFDLAPLIATVPQWGNQHHFGLFEHPRYKRTIADEVRCCIGGNKWGKDDPIKLRAQMQRYGKDLTVYASGIMIRRHEDPAVIEVQERWWDEIEGGSIRDQVSFPWVLQQTNFNPTILAQKQRKKYFILHPHKKHSSWFEKTPV